MVMIYVDLGTENQQQFTSQPVRAVNDENIRENSCYCRLKPSNVFVKREPVRNDITNFE
jgi:hypothetical protein